MFKYANALDGAKMVQLWDQISSLLLCSSNLGPIARDLEEDLYRFFLVLAARLHRDDVIQSFLRGHTEKLGINEEWALWFGVGILHRGNEKAALKVYFTDEWRDRFEVS